MKYFVVDAFADELFTGNPAGVCVLDTWPADSVMQSIAAENNLAETAFFAGKDGHYDLRWFTPETEMDLCGHATLASAFIISKFVDTGVHSISFNSKSGILVVTVDDKKEFFTMDFPARPPEKTGVNPIIQQSINAPIREAHRSRDLLVLLDTEDQIANLEINMELLKTVTDCFAFIFTAPSSHTGCDFVSRFFAPNAGIPEDPVTGSSHCTLIPFWAERLGKNKLTARQLSKRGGTLYCENSGNRVRIAGKAKLYLEGELAIGI